MENQKDKRLYYEMTIAGCKRYLPVCPLNENLSIAGFVILGDYEITEKSATELLKKVPEYDLILTAESKGIPLAHEMARQHGDKKHIVARKSTKLYMRDIKEVEVHSITTDRLQHLYLDGDDAALMQGKRILIVDDVISTGESLHSLETLCDAVGAEIVGRACILAEGDSAEKFGLIYLEKLPLLTPDGEPIW